MATSVEELYQKSLDLDEKKRADLAAAKAFLAELDQALERVRESPQRWSQYGRGLHRYILPRFPFSMIYQVDFFSYVMYYE